VSFWRSDDPGLARRCGEFNAATFSEVARDPAVKVVVLEGAWGPAEDLGEVGRYVAVDSRLSSLAEQDLLQSGLQRAIIFLTQHGKRVLIIGNTPIWSFDPSRRLITSYVPARRALARLVSPGIDFSGAIPDAGALRLDDVIDKLSARNNVHFISVMQPFCSQVYCTYRDNGASYFMDRGHLSPEGAIYALERSNILAAAAEPGVKG
jgi:hypothetical protein